MRSATRTGQDLTAKARIREAGLRLFGERGYDGTTVRQIATAAKVSPALVMRHFGSKPGLRRAVEAHALATLEGMLAELTGEGAGDAASVAAAMARHLPAASPLPAYLRRMLLEGGAGARRLFQRLFLVGRRTLDELAAAGAAGYGKDREVRAAFLTANDLAVFLLREPLTRALGFDPLTPAGLQRWGVEVMAIYGTGLGGKQ